MVRGDARSLRNVRTSDVQSDSRTLLPKECGLQGSQKSRWPKGFRLFAFNRRCSPASALLGRFLPRLESRSRQTVRDQRERLSFLLMVSMRQINFSVDDRVHNALAKRAGGYKPTAYAKMLFEAAFACRCGVTQDADLDDQIRLAIVLHAARADTVSIAKRIGLSEATVTKISDGHEDHWRMG